MCKGEIKVSISVIEKKVGLTAGKKGFRGEGVKDDRFVAKGCNAPADQRVYDRRVPRYKKVAGETRALY